MLLAYELPRLETESSLSAPITEWRLRVWPVCRRVDPSPGRNGLPTVSAADPHRSAPPRLYTTVTPDPVQSYCMSLRPRSRLVVVTRGSRRPLGDGRSDPLQDAARSIRSCACSLHRGYRAFPEFTEPVIKAAIDERQHHGTSALLGDAGDGCTGPARRRQRSCLTSSRVEARGALQSPGCPPPFARQLQHPPLSSRPAPATPRAERPSLPVPAGADRRSGCGPRHARH